MGARRGELAELKPQCGEGPAEACKESNFNKMDADLLLRILQMSKGDVTGGDSFEIWGVNGEALSLCNHSALCARSGLRWAWQLSQELGCRATSRGSVWTI